jgi:hypothetical protein
MNMKKIKGLEYQSPNRRTVKPPSVFIPILLLIGLAVFFVFASEVKGSQLFRVIPDPIETPAPPILNEIADVVETQEIFEATETTEPVIAEVPALKGLEESLFEVLASTEGIWSANQWSIDQITYNADQDQALVWLGAVDPETGLVMASEPLQVYAQKTLDGTSWEIVLEDNPAFAKSLSLSDLAGSDVVSKSAPTSDIKTTTPRIYGGYYLPWHSDLKKVLTWSVAHTSCNPTYYCTYAFDFADGTMFDLVAAKAGIVYHWKDTCANGVSTCTNSITLEDRSTETWTYQIYLHLAYNSIPIELKQVGVAVNQGQFIGNVDDTGYSTGHHVHFMVVAKDTLYKTSSGYYFGRAEDITFRDVFINWDEATQGGRPRRTDEATTYGGEGQNYYISGNAEQKFEYIFTLFFN